MRKATLTLSLLLTMSAALLAEPQEDRSVEEISYYSGMEYRNVGPHRGGRVTAVTGVPGELHTFYMGSAGGGVWRTDDAGESWQNLTDGQIGAGGIGAIAVAPSDPNVIYIGTGSACIRGNVSPGIGAYRSSDAGMTWEAIGLEGAGQISRMIVHPSDPETVYVAVLGNAFAPSDERGVYRSTDGGANWEHVLHLDESTGISSLSIDPSNARVLYAGAWGGVERKPWDLRSGGEHGGVYKTTDGGDTWDKLAGGLPGGIVGKVGVAVSPADPGRVFALVEHEKGGLYRSENAGASWKLINPDHMLWERPWYYMHVIPDPQNSNTVWVQNVFMQKSEDGGASFRPIPSGHPDYHAMWINPDDTDVMIIGDDGGAEVSLNGGRTWSTIRNQATAELYRVSVDDQFPYRLYGAQQDNSTISVPSRLPPGMASDHEAEFQVGGCESGHIAVDPRNPDVIYAGCYGGSITRLDRKTGQSREIIAYPQLQLAQDRGDLKFRYQWNAPIRISPHDPDVLYHTSQFVHRSTDEGHSWEVISPDLTTNNPEHQGYAGGPLTRDGTGVEVYGTIFSFEESALEPGILWTGSDDGRLHLSKDNGANWTEITPPDLPEGATVNTIDLSTHQDGRALVAAFRYREGDRSPYIFATDDYGATWRSLAEGNGIAAHHFVRVVREDPDRRGLLYAGTEYGMYVSVDDGESWQSLQLNLPATPVTDIQVHHGDLVLATQGRSFWILDDLTPLHALTDEVRSAAAWLTQPAPAHRLNGSGGFSLAGGRRATDAPNGVVFDYFLAEGTEGPVTLTIKGPDGEVVREIGSEPPPGPPRSIPEVFLILAETFGIDLGGGLLSKNAGHNRYVWDMSFEAPRLPPGAVIFGWLTGPTVVPGTYEITLAAGDTTQTRTLEILPDPRASASIEDMQAQLEFLQDVGERITVLSERTSELRSVRGQAKSAGERVAEVLAATAGPGGEGAGGETVSGEVDERAAKVAEAVESLTTHLSEIEQELLQVKSRSFEDPLNYPGKLTAQLANLYTVVNSGSDAPPTAASVERLGDLDVQLEDVYRRLDVILDTEVANLNVLVNDIELPAVVLKGD